MFIGIVDYGMGNLVSVRNALEAVGANVRVLECGDGVADVGAIVVPGVGAFARGMEGLRERGFVDALERDVRERQKPFLGICLGLQLLATRGTELGDHAGLGWVPGIVQRLTVPAELRVPHVGWNEVEGASPLLEGIPARASFYFVHSYHFACDDTSRIGARTDHGGEFASIIDDGNIHAVQFHPEKSHKHGLSLLRNWVALANRA